MVMHKRINLFCILGLISVVFILNLTSVAGAYEVQSNRQNSVRVDVQPVQLKPGQPVKFEIRLNTHSEDLGQDLIAVSALEDNNGRKYRPIDWDGSPPGGHHRQGVLAFPALDGTPASITLVIRDIAAIPARIFKWSLEN